LICKIFINVYYNLIIDTYSDKSEFKKKIRIITYSNNINNDIIIALLTNMNYYMINITIVDTNIVAGTNDEKARLLHDF
jgi:transcription antitermination factor NusA-like protein